MLISGKTFRNLHEDMLTSSESFRYHTRSAHGSLHIHECFANCQTDEDILRGFCVVGGGRQIDNYVKNVCIEARSAVVRNVSRGVVEMRVALARDSQYINKRIETVWHGVRRGLQGLKK